MQPLTCLPLDEYSGEAGDGPTREREKEEERERGQGCVYICTVKGNMLVKVKDV